MRIRLKIWLVVIAVLSLPATNSRAQDATAKKDDNEANKAAKATEDLEKLTKEIKAAVDATKKFAAAAKESADAAKKSADEVKQSADVVKKTADSLAKSVANMRSAPPNVAAVPIAIAPRPARAQPRFQPPPRVVGAAPAPVGFQYPQPISAPPDRIHTLLFSNTDDRRGGQSISDGVRANHAFLNALLDVECGGLRINEAELIDSTFTSANVISAIRNMQVGANDVVFCYISTHGGFATNGPRAPRPEHMLETAGGGSSLMLRSQIMNELRQTRAPVPRLVVLISDSCGTRFVGPAPAALRALPTATRIPAEHALYKLLIGTTGEISINAAEPGTEALYFPDPSTAGGGLLTRAFCERAVFSKATNWSDFFSEVTGLSQRQDAGQPRPCLFDGAGLPVNAQGGSLN